MFKKKVAYSDFLCKIIILLYATATIIIAFSPLSQVSAAPQENNDRNIFVLTDSVESEGKYLVSAANADFGPAGLGMTAEKNARLIKTDIGEVIYKFDMKDTSAEAIMTVAGRFINLSYSLDASGPYTKLEPIEMPQMWMNHAVAFTYRLFDGNVFAKSNTKKEFYIKVTGGIAEYDGWLFSISVISSEFLNAQDMNLIGIRATQGIYKHDGLLYGDPKASSVPSSLSLYVIQNGKLSFKHRFDPSMVISVSPVFEYNSGDNDSKKIRFSYNGSNWKDYKENSAITPDPTGWIYIEILNTGADDVLLSLGFTTVLKEILFLDQPSQENKDFGYQNEVERASVTPLPDPEGFPDFQAADEPEWFKDDPVQEPSPTDFIRNPKIYIPVAAGFVILVAIIAIVLIRKKSVSGRKANEK